MSSYYTPPNPAAKGSALPPKTLILQDGGPSALLACAVTREALALAGGGKGARDIGAVLFGGARARAGAVLRQCELFGVTLLDFEPLELPKALSAAEREAHELLHAVTFAAKQGFERVLWPLSAALGDSLDLDRIAAIVDRAVLVGRLVGLDARDHGVPSIRVDTPYADFTDRQIADLVADMELPIETCWWWAVAGDGEAEREKRRWLSALGAVGWTAAVG